MSDTARIYFVVTSRGDVGPCTMGEIAEKARASEVGLQDQVRTAFGRNLGTIAECLANGKIPSPSSRLRPSRPSPEPRCGGRLIVGALVGGVLVTGLAIVIARGRQDSIAAGSPGSPEVAGSPSNLSRVASGTSGPPLPDPDRSLAPPPRPIDVPTGPPIAASPSPVPVGRAPTISTASSQAGPPIAPDASGAIVIEAEHPTAVSIRDDTVGWSAEGTIAGAIGTGYMTCSIPGHHPPNASWQSGSEMAYAIAIGTPGTYRIWMRVNSPDSTQDSAFIGMDGVQIAGVFDNTSGKGWYWIAHSSTIRLDSGRHVLQVRRREAGYRIDRIILSPDPTFKPAGAGPAQGNHP